MSVEKPDCTIVIRAYNEEAHIGRLLQGISQQTLKNVQVVLVDSGSTDRTVEIARQYPVEITHIAPDEFTFGRSLNLGIQQARADYVVMASAHVYPVYPDWLEKLVAPLQKDEQIALSYGKQRGAEVTMFSEHQIFHNWFGEQSTPRQSHPFCNNANCAVRKTLWEVHPYDEAIPALEDLAWARWAFDQGYAIAYSAEAEIIHVHQQNWRSIFNRYRREGMAFKQIYPQEHFTWLDLIRLWTGNVVNDLRAAGELGRFWKEMIPVARFRWAQFFGTYQGYRQSSLTWQLKQAFYYPNASLAKARPAQRGVMPIDYSNGRDCSEMQNQQGKL